MGGNPTETLDALACEANDWLMVAMNALDFEAADDASRASLVVSRNALAQAVQRVRRMQYMVAIMRAGQKRTAPA